MPVLHCTEVCLHLCVAEATVHHEGRAWHATASAMGTILTEVWTWAMRNGSVLLIRLLRLHGRGAELELLWGLRDLR